MTEERKKYLDSITNEERIVREMLEERKHIISLCKEDLNRCWLSSVKMDVQLKMIAGEKVIIKALKKQLHAPKRIIIDNKYITVKECSVCKDVCLMYSKYCPRCGQKLR